MMCIDKKKMAVIVSSRELPSYNIYIKRMLPLLEKGFDLDLFDQSTVAKCSVDSYRLIYIFKIISPHVLEIAIAAQVRKIPVIYEVDDNFLAPAQTEYGKTHVYLPGDQALLAAILPRASLLLVYSRKSFERMLPYNPNIAIMPTYQHVYADAPPKRKAGPRIVGFMGTLCKELNFGWMLPALQRIAAKYPDVSFEFLGFMPPGAESLPSVRHVPLVSDYEAFIKNFATRNWAAALAPLADVEYNLSKTNVKYKEYAAAGYPGVYSNLEPYSNTVTDKITGLLADNESEAWTNAIEQLLHDPQLAEAIVKNAWNDMRANYQFERYCQAKMGILYGMAEDPSQEKIDALITVIEARNKQIRRPA